jgi:hypothetical protein
MHVFLPMSWMMLRPEAGYGWMDHSSCRDCLRIVALASCIQGSEADELPVAGVLTEIVLRSAAGFDLPVHTSSPCDENVLSNGGDSNGNVRGRQKIGMKWRARRTEIISNAGAAQSAVQEERTLACGKVKQAHGSEAWNCELWIDNEMRRVRIQRLSVSFGVQ